MCTFVGCKLAIPISVLNEPSLNYMFTSIQMDWNLLFDIAFFPNGLYEQNH